MGDGHKVGKDGHNHPLIIRFYQTSSPQDLHTVRGPILLPKFISFKSQAKICFPCKNITKRYTKGILRDFVQNIIIDKLSSSRQLKFQLN